MEALNNILATELRAQGHGKVARAYVRYFRLQQVKIAGVHSAGALTKQGSPGNRGNQLGARPDLHRTIVMAGSNEVSYHV